MFNPMWVRLGLMDYIDSILPAEQKYDYNVTFKSFEPAAAFVNRANEHYLNDELLYATWESGHSFEPYAMAIIMIPKGTLDVLRQQAIEDRAWMSVNGYPLVEWSRAVWAVLTRMRLSIGTHGDCRRYRVIEENPDRVVIGMVFKDHDMLNYFLERKKGHYLTSARKDRFFAKAHAHMGY